MVDKQGVLIYFVFEKLKKRRINGTVDEYLDIEVFYWWYQYRLSIKKTSIYWTIWLREEIMSGGGSELTGLKLRSVLQKDFGESV
jgi:hypothetical protein